MTLLRVVYAETLWLFASWLESAREFLLDAAGKAVNDS